MNHDLAYFKKWYENRQTREQLFILLLGWVLVYALFSFFLLNPLSTQQRYAVNEIKSIKDQMKTWNMQINALNQLSYNPLYKQWLNQHQVLSHLQSQHQYLMKTASAHKWHQIIKTILQTKDNITIAQIKDFPEAPYNPTHLAGAKSNIYQKKLALTFYGNYFDTIAYLQRLEKSLPTIHWDNLHYQVAQHPVAKIEMELSIFYEKNNS
ncbi:MAG: hypothetical protein A3F42_07250 [Gammaproteobacteria bacterium RIFCSPHIGHO2_12_FULL_37_34]|nr:MAG: hypothetical protein A3F42_07250 [Gammaproteobacteria bacterium RIFCSPHIGHO2_12_FULL_37_34]